jgi:hypothetical protein
MQSDPHAPLRLKRFCSAAQKPSRPAGAMEPQTVGHDVKPKEHGDRPRESIVDKFGKRKTRRMQAERQSAAGNEHPANFRQRFLNVHVGEGNRRNDAIETFSLKRQALAGTKLIATVWKSQLRSRETSFVNVNARNFIRRDNAPRS